MNKNILKISTLVAIWAFCSQNATAQQGFGTNQPSKASVIEMKSGTKGLLIPRVALNSLNSFGPIVGNAGITPAETNSLMVYNTTTDTSVNLTEGYYYWTATDANNGTIGHWQRFMTGTDEAALALDGDVTGPLDNTTVGKIQGRDVASIAPTSNQVLTWNGTAWTPTSLTPAQITNKATLSVEDGIAITAGSGADALLGAATIGITDGGIAPEKIQPAEEPTTRMVMVTQTDGTVTWIPQTDIAPTTTNALSSADNSMTSNVNGVSRSADIINSNGLSVTGTELTSTVNGVPATVDLAPAVTAATTHTLGMSGNTLTSIVNGVSPTVDVVTSNTLVLTGDDLVSTVNGVATTPAVDLSKYLDNTDEQEITDFSLTGDNLSITIENGNTMTVPLSSIDTDNQTITNLSLAGNVLSITLERGGDPVTVDLTALTNTTNLGNGTNTTVSGDGSSTTPYTVNVATGSGTTLGVVRQADTAPSVTVTNGVLAVVPGNVAITNALTSSGNQMSSTVNGGTAQTAPIINTNVLSLNIDNHLVSTINGIPSAALDLSAAIQGVQKTTTVKAGTNTTVTPATPNATGNTEYEVSVATATASALGVVKPGTGLTVDTDGTLNATQATVTNTVTGHKIADVTTSAGTTAINETVTLLSQNATGINYINENGDAGVTAKVVSENANNLIATGTDFGAFLNATTVQNNQLNTVVAQGSGIAVTSSTSGNTTTYTVAAKAISGVEVHDDNVKLGGDLTRVTTITADATNTLAIAGLQPTTDAAKTTDAFVVVGGNGVLKKADIKYSTTEQVTGKKWIGGQVVYERVLEVTLDEEANTITLPTGSRPAKIIGMRMISRADNSITTELSRYDATLGVMVFGSGPTTQFQKVGTYDLILEYIK